jgi:flavodoxin I
MKKNIAILFGPEGGNTEKVAKLIAQAIGEQKCVLLPIKNANEKTISGFKSLIVGGSTIGTHNWSIPNSSSDWDEFLPVFKKINFADKNVALFGLGDHLAYPNNFVDGMRIIYDVLNKSNANVLGQCKTDDYEFNESQAVVDGKFVGLPIDEDYEEELTQERIDAWLKTFIELM